MSCAFLLAYVCWELQNWLFTGTKVIYLTLHVVVLSYFMSMYLICVFLMFFQLSYERYHMMAFQHHREGQILFPKGRIL